MKYKRTIQTPTVRHYKDPDLGKVSHNISMTDAQYEKLKAAAKHFGRPLAEFIAAQVDNYMLLVTLRRAEKGK